VDWLSRAELVREAERIAAVLRVELVLSVE
jgi:hypothetical protein